MHADPAYSASYQPYLDTLPAADAVLSPEMWTQDMVAALQSPELVRTCRRPAAKEHRPLLHLDCQYPLNAKHHGFRLA